MFTYKYISPHWLMTFHHYTCNLTAEVFYLKVVSLVGSLLHLIHLSLSGSNFSTQYPVMGLPPSSSGSNQVRVTASLAISEGVTLVGEPGGSETDGKLCDLSLDLYFATLHQVSKMDHFKRNIPKEYFAMIGGCSVGSPMPYWFSALILKMYSFIAVSLQALKVVCFTVADSFTHSSLSVCRLSTM